MWSCLALISAFAVIWPPTVLSAPDKIICYHGTWAHWRSGNGKFVIADIDTNLCTHVNYAFAGINSDGTIRLNSDDAGFLTEYGKLKSRTPKPKLLIAIGGWSEGSVTFSQVARNANLRQKFLTSTLDLIKRYDFDGFDFDWEYPTQREGIPEDKKNFVTLLEEFRKAFNERRYLLTAAVSASTSYYDVPGIAKSLDFINVMTYDFAGSWNSATAHHSSFNDSRSSINAWKSAGAPANKLVLGIGTYGRTFTLKDANNNGIGAPVNGGGAAGPYTRASGYLGYHEICENLKAGWKRVWHNPLSIPYAYNGNQWVGYDDADSIKIKAQFAVDNDLSGLMIWSVETDDFRGACGSRYPLLNAIKTGLKLDSPAKPNVICYHGTWSHWRSGNGKFVVADIDTNFCTHVNYAFVGIKPDGTIRLNSDDTDYPAFLNEYKKLKDRNPKPKVLLAIGGWSEGSVNFSIVAANSGLRKNLLNNALTLIRQYDFDGLDFDWEYPGDRGGGPDDTKNFVTLLEEFRAEFNKYGYLLTAAVSGLTRYYDVPGIAKSLDFINVMTYDFTGSWNTVTGHHSSFPDSVSSINAWKSAGAPANKLVLAIGTFGRSFTLTDPNNNGVGAPASGGGVAGQYTKESGFLGYHEICENLAKGWKRIWSASLSAPYAYSGNQWVGYDDVESIALKTKFVIDNKLKGVMVWSVETDDFKGTCGSRYPLLNAIKKGLSV